MQRQFPGIILSGGRSSRMGQPKALLRFGQRRLLDHICDRALRQGLTLSINSNDPAIAVEGIASFADRIGGFQGPLAGIHAGLWQAAHAQPPMPAHVATIAVDTPFFPTDLIARLAAALTGPDDIAIAASDEGLHPVIGLWPVSQLARLTQWLENPPTLKVRAFLDGQPVKTVAFPTIRTALGPVDPFFNINTPRELEWAEKILYAAAST